MSESEPFQGVPPEHEDAEAEAAEGGYERTMRLASERPDLLPLLRVAHDMGDQAFNEGLAELDRRGILSSGPWPEPEPEPESPSP